MLFSDAFSQNKVITFAPVGLTSKIRVKYESKINNEITAGSYFNLYYLLYRGLRLDPFIRLYPNGKAPKGMFIQGKLVGGVFNKNIEYLYTYITIDNTWFGYSDTTVHEVTHKNNTTFLTYGAGIGIGYQFIFGRSQKPLELYIGFQYSKYTPATTILYENKEYYTYDDQLWYTLGAGSFLNASFGIGFTF